MSEGRGSLPASPQSAHRCQRCGSDTWTDVDYSGCSDCRDDAMTDGGSSLSSAPTLTHDWVWRGITNNIQVVSCRRCGKFDQYRLSGYKPQPPVSECKPPPTRFIVVEVPA